jgi:catechol 2,3-dioxygenase-like lactoylglutathione lyase family enzyme
MAGSGTTSLDRRAFLKSAAVAGASGMVSAAEGKVPMDAHPQQPWSLKMVVPLEPGIVCLDLDRMLEFYVGVLGLKVVSDAQATAEMSARFKAVPDGFRIVRLQTPYGERIKLIQSKVRFKKAPISEWTFERQGFAYITFVIADMKEVMVRLTECRVKLVNEEPVEVRKGFVALFALDPEDNYLEFVEYQDPASYRPDLFKWRQFF